MPSKAKPTPTWSVSPSPIGSPRSAGASLRSRIPGEPYAPAVSTTWSARTSPSLVATPTARSPANSTRSTSVSAADGQALAPTRRVEVREGGVPAHRAHVVDRVHDGVDTGGPSEGPMPRRELLVGEAPHPQLALGALQIRSDDRVVPTFAPLVVVGRRAGEDDARVVGRAAADDPRAQLRAVLALGLPRVREGELARVEDVARPAPGLVGAVVGARPRPGTRGARPRSAARRARTRPSRRRRSGTRTRSPGTRADHTRE